MLCSLSVGLVSVAEGKHNRDFLFSSVVFLSWCLVCLIVKKKREQDSERTFGFFFFSLKAKSGVHTSPRFSLCQFSFCRTFLGFSCSVCGSY